jgi:hypothetical protein
MPSAVASCWSAATEGSVLGSIVAMSYPNARACRMRGSNTV